MLKFCVTVSAALASFVAVQSGYAQTGGDLSRSAPAAGSNVDQRFAAGEATLETREERETLFREFLAWKNKQAAGSNAGSGRTCLSDAEARKVWPREHLYWHTAAHCWDATPGPEWRKLARARRTARFDLASNQVASYPDSDSARKGRNAPVAAEGAGDRDALFREFLGWSKNQSKGSTANVSRKAASARTGRAKPFPASP
jgi:hypothetical protein